MYICVFVCHCLCRFSLLRLKQTNSAASAAALPQWVTHSCSWAAQRDEQWDGTIVSVFFRFLASLERHNKAFINTCK